MKEFLHEDFFLTTRSARRLYHEHAAQMPVIDYHCHLSPAMIASDHRFANITEAWLYGDHYKWRAMRTNGIDESYCTGSRPDREKFARWAATVPYTLRNPLYHWTHLELRRYFGIQDLLSPLTAEKIYESCSGQLAGDDDKSVLGLLARMNVKMVCTTDDPCDDLAHHAAFRTRGPGLEMLPAFRPDTAMQVSDPETFNRYVGRLEACTDRNIVSLDDFLEALLSRHDFFSSNGCRVSDHGLEEIPADDFTQSEVAAIFGRLRSGNQLTGDEQRKIRSALLFQFALWDHEKGWVQQLHLGALRNNNSRMKTRLGPDTGWDSIGDFRQAVPLAKFLDRLDRGDRLARTILYNLNPADNELMATMAGNFNDGSVPGKIQFGSGWWFLDQKDGMTRQLNALSNMGLLSRFVGMLTDSRSFLSFPRHEYFRRILCGMLGEEMEAGELPADTEMIGGMVRDICYNNAVGYFGWQEQKLKAAH